MAVRVGRRFGVALSLSGGHDDRSTVLCIYGRAVWMGSGQGFGCTMMRVILSVVCTLVIALCAISPAQAADSRSQAFAKCMNHASAYQVKDTNLITSPGTCVDKGTEATGKYYQCQYSVAAYYQGPVSVVTCGDYPYDNQNNCKNAPPLTNVSVRGSIYACSNQCQYTMNSAGGVDVCMGGGADLYCAAKNWSPTGQECQQGDAVPSGIHEPDKQTCSSTGGAYAECIRSDGTHCVTGAAGSTLCWKPELTGPRQTADGTYAGDRQKAPATPTPPPNLKDPKEVSNTTTTVNNTTYNTTTWSSSGSKGGQGNVGEGGKDNGSGGSGGGSGSGDGDGDGDGDSDDPGEGSPIGDLYTKSDKTVESVVSRFATQVRATPLAGGIASFMTVPSGGSCPVFSLGASKWWDAMTIDFHCSGTFLTFLRACGWVILAIAAYAAIRIAVT